MNRKIEEVTTEKKKCSRGWYEPEKNEEGKSKRHSEVAGRMAIKHELRDTSRSPMRKALEIPEPEIEAETEKRRPFRIRNFFKKQDVEEEREEAEDETAPDTDEEDKEEQEDK